jgi:pyruvate,orthophosphate dikinase
MGKCCVAGADDVNIDYKTEKFTVKGTTIKKGDWISIDGTTGEVSKGKVATVEPKMTGDFGKFMKICDTTRTLGVRTNADTPEDAERARELGAEGIGLCRTEHMFFQGQRIWYVRQMILAADEYANMMTELEEAGEDKKLCAKIEKKHKDAKKQFEGALKKLLPYQRKDFEKIFKAMDGLPVTVRLLDPPLHEFLPNDAATQKEMAKRLGVSRPKVRNMVDQLHEMNPMLGHRGCRLAITYPAIYRMQSRAIMEAATNVAKDGVDVQPEIMIPLAGEIEELRYVKNEIVDEMEAVLDRRSTKVKYLVGTMIEIPRAALTADEIADEAQFFSFGTNDLTQMTMGFSRDDAGKFLGEYVNKGIYEKDPFQSLDIDGVGQLVRIGVEKGRSNRKTLKIGICGEHGGDPASVDFCNDVGMDYVSCSPFRVPIARLAAAQAQSKHK